MIIAVRLTAYSAEQFPCKRIPLIRCLLVRCMPCRNSLCQLPCLFIHDCWKAVLHQIFRQFSVISDLLMRDGVCNGIFNHTSLCEFNQGKLLLHLTIPFERKPKTNLPSDNLKYYRQRKQMTTRQLAEKLDIVPATVVMYENGKHPIPYDVAVKLADVLEIEASLLYDDFSRFLAVPYTEVLKSVRTALGLSQKAFAEQMGLVPSYYYKLEEGSRRPSRKVYQQMCVALKETNPQTSLLKEYHLQ